MNDCDQNKLDEALAMCDEMDLTDANLSYPNPPSKESLMLIWNTKTLNSFQHLNFDMMLDSSNITGTETYIKLGHEKEATCLEGFEFVKKHKDSDTNTIYFVETEHCKDLPIIINEIIKVRYAKKVYNRVVEYTPMKIRPEKKMSWRELIDYGGIPEHSNQIHWALYKNLVTYGRLKGQVFYRIITESAFGKDKFKESIRILLGKCRVLNDPSRPNVFYSAIYNKDITICELPSLTNGDEFNKMCNQFMRLGDGTTILDNPSRAKSSDTEGTTYDVAHTDKLSLSFIHNVPKYYHDVGKKGFDEIWSFNVINRFYYCLLDGFLDAKFPHNINHYELAVQHSQFIKDWIKTALWFEEHWHEIENPYPEFYLEKFTFPKECPRFKDHFIDMARCFSQYARNETEYMKLLIAYYEAHLNYKKLITNQQETQTEFDLTKIKDVNHHTLKDVA